MLFSYQQALEAEQLCAFTRRFARAATSTSCPQGLIFGSSVFSRFLEAYGVGEEISSLINAITDEASVERVEHEIRRLVVTGRIPEDVVEGISDAREILSMDEQLNVSDIPLVAVLFTDHPVGSLPVIINIVGKKALADALRSLWSRVFVHPYPSGIPRADIVLYRMPPALSCARVVVEEDGVRVFASRGWGRFVGSEEVVDTFVCSSSGDIVSKDVRVQDKMVYRNPRTGEVVVSSVSDASSQAITDRIASSLALRVLRLGLQEAVFGVGEEKHWLLQVGSSLSQTAVSSSEEVVSYAAAEEETGLEEEGVVSSDEETLAIEIVELEEDVVEEEPEEEVHSFVSEPEEVIDDPMLGSVSRSGEEEVSRRCEELLEVVFESIRELLVDWLHSPAADDFAELVGQVATKRVVPYKNRLLTLHEMRSQGAFSNPSPEAVRFALETFSRFKSEF
ncbi:MAG: PEP/pyruvate-binding domain-containing protein [Candidatus Woesearchaeota archaeon]